ncbi:MAG: type II toxin-antitoxin system VapC family toxin [Myxococcota bacterium]
MRAVDTNVVVRLLARDDEEQTAAAEAFVEAGAWVSHLVLVESTWVLSAVYERTSAQLAVAIGLLLEHDSLVIQDEDVVASALQKFREAPKVGFSDCLILETARKAGHLPLGTFDKALSRLDGTERLEG